MKNYTQVRFTKSVQIQTDIKQNIHQTQMSEVHPFDIAFLSNKQQQKVIRNGIVDRSVCIINTTLKNMYKKLKKETWCERV